MAIEGSDCVWCGGPPPEESTEHNSHSACDDGLCEIEHHGYTAEATKAAERVPPKIMLCAPTGKAAKRMYEQTGKRAHTIHKLLEVTAAMDGGFVFARNAKAPLEADVVIVDETSMVDVALAAALIEAVKPGARLILIGDTDQLPSVGPGSVLRDILASNVVPHARLETIKRQDAGAIVETLAQIRRGEVPEWPDVDVLDDGPDLRFVSLQSEVDIRNAIENIVCNGQHSRAGDVDPLRDVQVIAPLRTKTSLSCASLNTLLQTMLNAANPVIIGARDKPLKFRVGDKVMQMKNQYSRDLINGDVGYVQSIDVKKREVVVEFDDPKRTVRVPLYDNDLELAYACTVHKYQGSEARVVVIPVHRSFGSLIMQRPLIYTAISRARELCIIVGHPKELAATIARNSPRTRWSLLKHRLRADVLGEEEAKAVEQAAKRAVVLDDDDDDTDGDADAADAS